MKRFVIKYQDKVIFDITNFDDDLDDDMCIDILWDEFMSYCDVFRDDENECKYEGV